MKIFSKILKLLIIGIITLIGVLIIQMNSTFGNYNSTAYDIFINLILLIGYSVLSILIISLTKKRIKQKKLYFLLLLPLVFIFVSMIYGKNYHKKIMLEGKIENYPISKITLFNNQTFEIRIQYPHVSEYIKGKFKKTESELVLIGNELEKWTDSLYTHKYLIKNDSIFEPINKKFKKISVYNNLYN